MKFFPIQDAPNVPKELAKIAYQTYVKFYGDDQAFDTIIMRGGFGWQEFACLLNGHQPRSDHSICLREAKYKIEEITEEPTDD